MNNHEWRPADSSAGEDELDHAIDDWLLVDKHGLPLARVFLEQTGPLSGRWAWFVEVDTDGTPMSGVAGFSYSQKEAKEMAERYILPETQVWEAQRVFKSIR